MRAYLTIILIGLVSAFIGIIPLFKRKADKYTVLSAFVLFLIMPLCGLSPEFTLDTMVVERYDRVCSFDPPSGDYLGAGKFKMCIPAFIGFCRSRCFYFLFGTLFIVNTGGKREDKPFRTD